MMIIRQGIPSASAFGQLVGRLVIFDQNEAFGFPIKFERLDNQHLHAKCASSLLCSVHVVVKS